MKKALFQNKQKQRNSNRTFNRFAETHGIPFLGEVPLGMKVHEGGDKGTPVVSSHPDSPQSAAFRKVAESLAQQISIEAMKPELLIMTKA